MVAKAFYAQNIQARKYSKIDTEAEDRAMHALWDRQTEQALSLESAQRYRNPRRRRLSNVVFVNDNIPTPIFYSSPRETRYTVILQVLAHILDPWLGLWRWSTPNRFDVVSRTLVAHATGEWESVMYNVANIRTAIVCFLGLALAYQLGSIYWS